jgi:hypothetical protein
MPSRFKPVFTYRFLIAFSCLAAYSQANPAPADKPSGVVSVCATIDDDWKLCRRIEGMGSQ